MSRSEPSLAAETTDTAGGHANDEEVLRVVATLERLADDASLSTEQLRTIVSATIRLYAHASERAGQELPPVTSDISTTDAITLACALVRSQNLTPFEMAMWFSRGQRPQGG
jgi:hypothetical protein